MRRILTLLSYYVGAVTDIVASPDGLLLATISKNDQELKIFEVINFG